MAVLDKAALKAKIAEYIVVNAEGEITELKVKELLDDIVDSYIELGAAIGNAMTLEGYTAQQLIDAAVADAISAVVAGASITYNTLEKIEIIVGNLISDLNGKQSSLPLPSGPMKRFQMDQLGGVTYTDDWLVVIDAEDLSDQVPVGLDTPMKITFGPGAATDYLTLDALGNLEALETSLIMFRVLLSIGRTNNAGEAYLFLRMVTEFPGGPTFEMRPIPFVMDSSKQSHTHEFTQVVSLVQGQKIWLELIRDSTGINNGQLSVYTPDASGWLPTASASVKAYLLKQ